MALLLKAMVMVVQHGKIKSSISIINNTVIIKTNTKRSDNESNESKEGLNTWDPSQKRFILTKGEFSGYEE